MKKVTVRVKAGSKKGPLVEETENGELVVYVREPAVEGKANEAVIKLLAEYFNVAKTSVQLVSGYKSKTKRFEIQENQE